MNDEETTIDLVIAGDPEAVVALLRRYAAAADRAAAAEVEATGDDA